MSSRSRLSAGGSNPFASSARVNTSAYQSPSATIGGGGGSNRPVTDAEVSQIVDDLLSGTSPSRSLSSSGIPTLRTQSDVDVAPVIAVQGPETTGLFTEVAEVPVGSQSLRRSSSAISRDFSGQQSFRILTEARTPVSSTQQSMMNSARPASSYASSTPSLTGSASNNFLPALMSAVKSSAQAPSSAGRSVRFTPGLSSSKKFARDSPVVDETTMVCFRVDDDEFEEELIEHEQKMYDEHKHHHHDDKHHHRKKKGLFGKVEDTADNLQSAVKKIPRWVYVITAFGLLVIIGMWLWKRIFIQYTDGPRVGDKKGSRSFGRLLGDGFIFQIGGAKPLAHPDTATKIVLGSGQPTALPAFAGKSSAAAAAAGAASSVSPTKETVVVTQRNEPAIVVEKTIPAATTAAAWPVAVPTMTTSAFMPTTTTMTTSPASGMQIVSDFERSPTSMVVAGSATGVVGAPVVTKEVIDTSTTSINLPQSTFTDWFKMQGYPK